MSDVKLYENRAAYQEALRLIAEAKVTKSKELCLSNLRLRKLPSEISQLSSHLEKLELVRCYELKDLSSLYCLQKLKYLDIQSLWLNGENEIELNKLLTLSTLKLSGVLSSKTIESIKALKGLQHLELQSVFGFTSLSELGELPNLESLSLNDCHGIQLELNLKVFKKLKHFHLYSYLKQENIILTIPHSLNALEIYCHLKTPLEIDYDNLKNLKKIIIQSPLRNPIPSTILKNLEELLINTDEQPDFFDSLKFCEKLVSLEIYNPTLDFNLRHKIPTLNKLTVTNCKVFHVNDSLESLEILRVISANKINNLNYVNNLTNLKELAIHETNGILSTAPFENLTQLKSLSLSHTDITDFSAFENLTNLQTLELGSLYKFSTNFIGKLTNLSRVITSSELALCNVPANAMSLKLPNTSSLEEILHLTNLTALTISTNEKVIDLSLLKNRDSLIYLTFFDSNNLEEIRGFEILKNLKNLTIHGCPSLVSLDGIKKLSNLKQLYFYGSVRELNWETTKAIITELPYLKSHGYIKLEHVPYELTHQIDLAACEDWYHEISTNEYSSPKTLKVMLLGNGRIGKTQLARKIKSLNYDSSVPSTHGIQIYQFPYSVGDIDIDLQTWDFGGQDVYLGTHSLFIDSRALYLLLWNPNSENNDLVTCEQIVVRNRPLSYWLAYLKSLASEQANVLVCQSQCDSPEDDLPAPIPHPQPIQNLRQLSTSSKVEGGLETFNPFFQRAIRQQIQRNEHTWIPKTWLDVETKLRQHQDKTMSFDEFNSICESNGVLAPQTLVTYLHQSGTVFYRSGCFENRIILDQAWALQGVYLLLERDDALPNLIQMGGKFTLETIDRLLWKENENTQDKHLFIEMMKQCGVCFPITDTYYLAPDALPSIENKIAEKEQIWQGATPNYHVTLRYEFLHDATMRFLLCKIGEQAKEAACYWRYGCCFYDSQHRAKVLFECSVLSSEENKNSTSFETYGQPGEINIQVQASSSELIEHIVESICDTNHLDSKAEVTWLLGNPEESKEPNGHNQEMHKEKNTPFNDIGLASPVPSNQTPVYFTYAWGKNESDAKQIICDEIFESLNSEKEIEVFRDKDTMALGDSIEEFERKIGRSPFVLMIISEKYLYESYHCMNELRLIYEHSQQQKDTFVRRVIPVILSDAKIDTPVNRLKVVQHWKKQKIELDELVKEVGAEAAGSETVKQLSIMTSFINSIADSLYWLADLVIDRTEDLQAETAVELVKKRIAESGK
ncbi:TIR domain-containing protein [Vibrio brasiliensis]|uniref:COR domain-containing protein n=1 Tax=Vibrio brasiliensis TaxID=170652 RepID=UPI001EFCFB7C|nr:COR domain-containing protein [Vibrio brasiliensis]MCG9647954.1 TIR domain-containing protein [Vibrio brasiliensis]